MFQDGEDLADPATEPFFGDAAQSVAEDVGLSGESAELATPLLEAAAAV